MRAMLGARISIAHNQKIQSEMKELFGEDLPENFTIGELMAVRQMEKAIKTGDTQAFNALVDQTMGRPVQAIAQTNAEGEDLPAIMLPALPDGMIIAMPGNIEGSDSQDDLPPLKDQTDAEKLVRFLGICFSLELFDRRANICNMGTALGNLLGLMGYGPVVVHYCQLIS